MKKLVFLLSLYATSAIAQIALEEVFQIRSTDTNGHMGYPCVFFKLHLLADSVWEDAYIWWLCGAGGFMPSRFIVPSIFKNVVKYKPDAILYTGFPGYPGEVFSGKK